MGAGHERVGRSRDPVRRTPAAAVHRTPVHTAAQRLQRVAGASGVRRMIQRAVAKAAASDEREREAEDMATPVGSRVSVNDEARPANDEEDVARAVGFGSGSVQRKRWSSRESLAKRGIDTRISSAPGGGPASQLSVAMSPSQTLSAPGNKSRATHPIPFLQKSVVQRKCACGGSAGSTGECAACRQKRLISQAPLVQPKLTVNQPGDQYEQEADRVADRVMRMASLERIDATPKPMVSLHAASDMALPTGGVPLASSERQFFEPRLGHQFSQVRIHSDRRAGSLARSLGARAFTAGRDIVFGAGEYAPSTEPGRRLLAHELAHVVQQGRAGPRAPATLRSPPAIQRACRPAGIGTQTGCNTPPDYGFFRRGNGRIYQFDVNCDTFATGHEANLVADGKALAPGSTVEVHGFASTDGNATFNDNLACARAKAAKKVLTDPVAAGGAGLAASNVFIDTHGPTPGPAADRRSVTIDTLGTPTPSPTPTPTPPALCPAVPATTPGSCSARHTGYCDAAACFPTDGWLQCVCTTSAQICDAVDAFSFRGAQGLGLELCIRGLTRPPTTSFALHHTRAKGSWFLSTNRCIWGHWREALEALHDPSRPVPSTLTSEWATAVIVCRTHGVGSTDCCEAQTRAEQRAIDRCGPYNSALFGLLPTDVPFTPACSSIAARFAPGPAFSGDFGNVADRVTFGIVRCC